MFLILIYLTAFLLNVLWQIWSFYYHTLQIFIESIILSLLCSYNFWVFTFYFFLHFNQYESIFWYLVKTFIDRFKFFKTSVNGTKIKINCYICLAFYFNIAAFCKHWTFNTVKIHFILFYRNNKCVHFVIISKNYLTESTISVINLMYFAEKYWTPLYRRNFSSFNCPSI